MWAQEKGLLLLLFFLFFNNSLTEIEFICHKIHLCKVFLVYSELCNFHYYLILKHFHHLIKNLPPDPDKLSSTFCLFEFTCFGYIM